MKSAQASSTKFVERASGATTDYVDGVRSSTKDQNALAIAAAERHKLATTEALNRGAYAKGLQKAGKAAYIEGVTKKGQDRFASGVAASAIKYAQNSGAYDSARGAADNLPRGVKGSEANFARSKAVGQALRAAKVGSSK